MRKFTKLAGLMACLSVVQGAKSSAHEVGFNNQRNVSTSKSTLQKILPWVGLGSVVVAPFAIWGIYELVNSKKSGNPDGAKSTDEKSHAGLTFWGHVDQKGQPVVIDFRNLNKNKNAHSLHLGEADKNYSINLNQYDGRSELAGKDIFADICYTSDGNFECCKYNGKKLNISGFEEHVIKQVIDYSKSIYSTMPCQVCFIRVDRQSPVHSSVCFKFSLDGAGVNEKEPGIVEKQDHINAGNYNYNGVSFSLCNNYNFYFYAKDDKAFVLDN